MTKEKIAAIATLKLVKRLVQLPLIDASMSMVLESLGWFSFSSPYARCCKILYILIFHFVLCSVLFVSLRLWTLMRSGTNVFEGQGQLVDWCLTRLECIFVHGYFTTVDKTMKEGRTYLHPGCQRAVMSLCSLIQVAYESGDRPQDDFHLRGLGRQYRFEAKQ